MLKEFGVPKHSDLEPDCFVAYGNGTLKGLQLRARLQIHHSGIMGGGYHLLISPDTSCANDNVNSGIVNSGY